MRSRRLLFTLLATTLGAVAQEAMRGEPIDLPTVLKLAGAQGIDVEIAEAKLREARAAADGSTWALFPTISPVSVIAITPARRRASPAPSRT